MNIQKEINIHNLFTGPVVTPTKAAIEYAFAAGLVFYSICYPISFGSTIVYTSVKNRLSIGKCISNGAEKFAGR